jgi:hypothetical protein
MKLSELIKQLRGIANKRDDDPLVVLSKDSEGNSFSPCYEPSDGLFYIANTSWYGDVYDEEDLEDCEIDKEDTEPVVVLWPTN